MSRTYKDQRKFDRKQETRKRSGKKEVENLPDDVNFDVMDTISPDWSNW